VSDTTTGGRRAAAAGVRGSLGQRRARLYVSGLDPWSVAKASFMLAVALGVILIVTVAVVWFVFNVTGVFDALARSLNDIVGNANATFDLRNFLSFDRVMGLAVLVGAVEIVLVSALGTVLAYLYNLTVGITGGLEVTLSDDA
jgi:hypothetical protein